jgi:hypothetical protein
MSDLKHLPKSSDKYWKFSDYKNIVDLSKLSPKRCEHEFIRVNGREVECKHCHIGYVLNSKSFLKHGHIYIGDKKVL